MTAIVSTAAGNWSNSATWAGGVVPGNGDRVWIKHAVVVDANTTVGESRGIAIAGTGTITGTSSSQILTGTGTHFTTDLRVGDEIIYGGNPVTVIQIDSDTQLTSPLFVAVVSGVSFTIRPRAVFVDGPAGGSLFIATNKTLTVRGDVALKTSTITLDPLGGAQLLLDSSLAAGTPAYNIDPCCLDSSSFAGSIISKAPSGNKNKIGKAASSGTVTISTVNVLSQLDTTNTDLDLGDASTDAISVGVAHGGKINVVGGSSLGTCGRFYVPILPTDADFRWNNFDWPDIPAASSMEVLNVLPTAGATGIREFKKNVAQNPLKDHLVNIQNRAGWVIEDNALSRIDCTGGAIPMGSFARNFFVQRNCGDNNSTNWSFVGASSDTLADNYFCNDEGPSQNSQHELMMTDSSSNTGTWTLLRYIYEKVSPLSAEAGDMVHIAGNKAVLDHVLELPTSSGFGSGRFRGRGDATASMEAKHCTLMGINPGAGSETNDGVIEAGSEYVGHADMVARVQSNLFWNRAVYAGPNTSGLALVLSRDGGSTVADILTAANYGYNAHYNVGSGIIYDQTGANGTAALGLDGFRQTVKPTLTNDVNLGTGSDERTQGPKFVDPTRNLATFDTAYLHNTATAWADAHSYAVGDIVSASTSTFYGGATINFRCVAAHTSNAANAVNGKPGSSTTNVASGYPSGYRQNWEFASAYRIRQAIVAGTTVTDAALGLSGATMVEALSAWVRAGFAPQNVALHNTAQDGTDIGAVPYSPLSSIHNRRTGGRLGTRIGSRQAVA